MKAVPVAVEDDCHTCMDVAVATVVIRQGDALGAGRRNARADWEQRREEAAEAGATGRNEMKAMMRAKWMECGKCGCSSGRVLKG